MRIMSSMSPSPRTQAIVPIEVRIPGGKVIRFPKSVAGKCVPEAELKRLWAEYVTPHMPQKPGSK